MENATVTFTLYNVRITQFRIWLACKVFILGARIAGCGIEFEMSRQNAKGSQ